MTSDTTDTTGSVKARLQSDLTAAMKARDEVSLSTIRMLRSAISNAEVAGDTAAELSDDDVIAVLQSEAKKRAESASVYEEAGRAELAAKERAELEVIERYLPAAMSDDELAAIVDEEVARAAAAGAEGGRAMGMVISAVRERAGAGADGSRVAALVKSRLAT
ncbi:MAG: glutamyl-tRNA amidotransferase [Acidimicrobiaceae bacterium]|nr:glutamyl-tRNA amidotransferase [Acidimicrobiaceae bacterium]